MLSYILRRLLVLIPTILGVTLLTFSLIRLIPGDPVEVMMGERTLDPEMHAAALARLGLDQPLYVQYGNYLGQLLQGDLGASLKSQVSVWTEFKALFPATLELAIMALLIALVLGMIAGVMAAVKRGTWLDHTVMTAALTGYSMPIFWWGLLLILMFSVGLGWTPVSGRIDLLFDVPPQTGFMVWDAWLAQKADPEYNNGAVWDALRHLILPAVVLATIPLAVIARMTRSIDAGGVAGRLCAHRTGQRPVARARDFCAHAAQRPDSGAHRGGPAGGHADGRRGADRDHLLLARHRQVADRCHRAARLPGGAKRHPAGGDAGHPDQLPGGHSLRRGESAHPGAVMNFREFWRAFAHNKGAVIGLFFMLIVGALAILAPWVAPHSPIEQYRSNFLQAPVWSEGGSWQFLFGTDELGRDLLSRLIHGARLSLLVGLVSVVLALIPGVILGLIAAFAGKWMDAAIMRAMDIMMALPSLLLAVAIMAILGPGLLNAMIAISLVSLPAYVRLVRASAMAELQRDYVTAARLSGARTLRLMFVTVLAQLHGAADRARHHELFRRHSGDRGAGLSGAGCAAAAARVGHHAGLGARLHRERLVGGDLAGADDFAVGAGDQSGGRRSARCAGPQAQDRMI